MKLIDHISFTDSMIPNPLPLDFEKGFTTSEFLGHLQSRINAFIDASNGLLKESTDYTDEEIAKVNEVITEIQHLIDTGEIIKDHSITFKKMNEAFIDDFQEFIIQKVYEATKFVFFGLTKDGYFVAYFPDTWNDIQFSTDIEGHLCLEY